VKSPHFTRDGSNDLGRKPRQETLTQPHRPLHLLFTIPRLAHGQRILEVTRTQQRPPFKPFPSQRLRLSLVPPGQAFARLHDRNRWVRWRAGRIGRRGVGGREDVLACWGLLGFWGAR
jgi:hypothetical protein